MNRRSLLPRAALCKSAPRPDYFRVHLEPLEKRQLLAGNTYYVNDTWIDNNGGSLNFGDSVTAGAGLDPNSTGLGGTYGIDCFGKSSTGSFSSGFEHIGDAIVAAASQDTVSLLEGTYTESDIVINRQILLTGTGTSGTADTLIVPEVATDQTAGALSNFGAAGTSHEGIIIYNSCVTVQQVHLNGNGNGSLGGSLNYHQGITHLYDTQTGGSVSTIRNGSLTPQLFGNIPDPGTRPNRSEELDLVQNVLVENVFWRGIVFSAPSGKQFGMSGTSAQNQVINSTVNNVGPNGSQDYDRVGILVMNVDNYPNESPSAGAIPAGNILNCVVNNAGVGAALRTFGPYDQNNGARNKGAISYTTVNSAVTIGIETSNRDSGAVKANTITGSSAVGLQISNSSTNSYSTITITGATVGVKVLDSRVNAQGGLGFPIFTLSTITGPGTAVPNSVGILLTNSSSAPEASASIAFGTSISGFQTGIKAEQPFAITGTHAISGAANNGIDNRIRITSSAASSLVTGNTVIISGVLGTTEANGKWTVTVINSTQFDLNGSTFVNAYTSGGTWAYPTALLTLDNPDLSGNANGVSVSGNYHVEGHVTAGGSLTGTGIELKAGNDIQPFQFYNSITNETISPGGNPSTTNNTPPSPAGIVPMPSSVDQIVTGDFSLDSTSTLRADINGALAYKNIQDFNGAPLFFPQTTQTNPWRSGYRSPGALGVWFGNTSQGGGSLTILPSATELGAVFDIGDINNPIDMRGMQMVQVVAKKVSGANPDSFGLTINDIDGTSQAYVLPMAGLNTLTYTTLTLNILTSIVKVQDGLAGLNMSAISGWGLVSDLGSSNMQISDTFGINIDSIGMIAPYANSVIKANGTVALNGATLNAQVTNAGFTPSVSQTFTLIDNDGADAVSGTFAGLPEGATVTLSGLRFKVSYVGNGPSGNANDVVLTRVSSNSNVVKTNLFYKGSTKWDVTNGATFSDDNAIAPDKTAYLPGGGTSTFAAVSSYDRGINGVMVDLSGPHGAITVNDFTFKRGNNNSPNAWVAATAPTAVTTRATAGTSGSDRIELLWADNDAVKKQWLEVIVEGNDTVGGFNTNTGLASSYVFYFGNPLGDTGTGNAGAFQVTSTDEVNARNNPKTFTATRSDVNDFNRDGSVNSSDQIIARNNITNLGNQLKFLVVGAGGPFAPESSGGGGGDSGVASGLAASSSSGSSGSASAPGWLGVRLDELGSAANASSSGGAVGQAVLSESDDDSRDDEEDELPAEV
jgi:hypothetical protein